MSQPPVLSDSPTTNFSPFTLRRSFLLPLPGRSSPSAISPPHHDLLLLSHSSLISSFNSPNLHRRSTLLSPLPAIDSLLPVSHSLIAAAAHDFPGLHLLSHSNPIPHVLHWSPHPHSLQSPALALSSSPNLLFASFETSLRNASAILCFDRVNFQPLLELARSEIFGAEIDSAIPANKLHWVDSLGLLLSAGSHSGPSGTIGNVRLWDVRSGEKIFEVSEGFDCFSDVTVAEELSGIFKVGVHSGSIYRIDFRKLGGEESWVCVGDLRRSANGGKKEGSGCRIVSKGKHVFCSRGGDIEVWSEVVVNLRDNVRGENGLEERVMKRNLMGRSKDMGGNKITLLGFVGDQMVVTRKDEECVEVWENSSSVEWIS